VPFVKNKK